MPPERIRGGDGVSKHRDAVVEKVLRTSDWRRAFGDVERTSHNLAVVAQWWFTGEGLARTREDAMQHVAREAWS